MKNIYSVFIIFLSISCCSGQSSQQYLMRGNEQLNSQDFQGAIIEFSKAIKLDPNNIEARYNNAISKYSINDFSKQVPE